MPFFATPRGLKRRVRAAAAGTPTDRRQVFDLLKVSIQRGPREEPRYSSTVREGKPLCGFAFTRFTGQGDVAPRNLRSEKLVELRRLHPFTLFRG